MTAAVLALALVAAIIIVPAIVSRRSSAGHRRLRDHHRALDTLGHITATQSDGTEPRDRSGFSAIRVGSRPSVLSHDGLATDAAGPQAHVRVVSPGSHTPLPNPRPVTEIPGGAGDEADQVEPAVTPPWPEEYQAAGQPALREETPASGEAAALASPDTELPSPGRTSGAAPAGPAVEAAPDGDRPDEPGVPGPLSGTRPAGPAVEAASDGDWPAYPVADEEGRTLTSSDDSAVEARRRAMFPGADPTVEAWHPRSTEIRAAPRRAAGPSFPESAPATSHGDDVITAPVPVTDPEGELRQEEEVPPAPAVEADDRPVRWAAPPVAAPRGRVNDRGRHRRQAPRRRKRRGRVAVGVTVVIVLAAGGVVAAHALLGSGPKSRGRVAAPPAVTTTVTTPPSTAPPRSTTVTTVAPPPFKLISNGPGISVYRIVGRPRITIRATGECWTEILRGNATGAQLYVQTMTAGVRHAVRGPVWIRLGDPTAVVIRVNGTKVKPPVTGGSPYDLQFE